MTYNTNWKGAHVISIGSFIAGCNVVFSKPIFLVVSITPSSYTLHRYLLTVSYSLPSLHTQSYVSNPSPVTYIFKILCMSRK